MRAGLVGAMLAVAVVLGGAGAARGDPRPSVDYAATARGVIGQVHQRGASTVAAELFAHKVAWVEFTGRVESADAEWIRAAAALRPGAQPDAAAELADAVRLALMIDANAVLANAIPGFSVEEVCSSQQRASSSSSSSLRSEEIVIRQIRAVKAVRSSHLAGVRKRCLERLEASRKALESPSP